MYACFLCYSTIKQPFNEAGKPKNDTLRPLGSSPCSSLSLSCELSTPSRKLGATTGGGGDDDPDAAAEAPPSCTAIMVPQRYSSLFREAEVDISL